MFRFAHWFLKHDDPSRFIKNYFVEVVWLISLQAFFEIAAKVPAGIVDFRERTV